jgi:hypothetical protein
MKRVATNFRHLHRALFLAGCIHFVWQVHHRMTRVHDNGRMDSSWHGTQQILVELIITNVTSGSNIYRNESFVVTCTLVVVTIPPASSMA